MIYQPVYHASHRLFVPRDGVMFFSTYPRTDDFGKYVAQAAVSIRQPWYNTEDQVDEVLEELTNEQTQQLIRELEAWEVTDRDSLRDLLLSESYAIWQLPVVVAAIRALGHDGVLDFDRFGGDNEYVVFSPSQVKIQKQWVVEK